MFVWLWPRPEGAACYPHELQRFIHVKDIDLKIHGRSWVCLSYYSE
jgi:hypothetical protein